MVKKVMFRAFDTHENRYITDYTRVKVFFLNGDHSLFTVMVKDSNGEYCELEVVRN